MCEIIIAKAINDILSERTVASIIDAMVEAGTIHQDGWGIFNEQAVVKKDGGQIKPESINACDYAGSEFVVGHLRWATIARNELTAYNAHPFRAGDVIIAHNGIIGNGDAIRQKFGIPNKSPKTDSYVIAWLANRYKKLFGGEYGKIIEAVCEELGGYYSVIMMDVPTKRLFYFRHNAEFTFALLSNGTGHIIAGATREERLKHIIGDNELKYGFSLPRRQIVSIMKPKESTVYEISDRGIEIIAENLPKPKATLDRYSQSLSKYINEYDEPYNYDIDLTGDDKLKYEDTMKAITNYQNRMMTAIDESRFLDEVQEFLDRNYRGVYIKKIFNGNCTIIDKRFNFVGTWEEYFTVASRLKGMGIITVDALRLLMADFDRSINEEYSEFQL